MSVLPIAVILALATDPACGAAAPGSEFAQRLAAIAVHESGGDATIVGVNGPGGGARRFSSAADAAAYARTMIAGGRSVDLGLMQINNAQIARHGLTVETAFDPCRSMKAGADHYAADVSAAAIWTRAHMIYNTGSPERGAAYAASVEKMLGRVRTVQAEPTAAPQPPGWDVWEQADRRPGRPSTDPTPLLVGRSQAAPAVMLHGLIVEKD